MAEKTETKMQNDTKVPQGDRKSEQVSNELRQKEIAAQEAIDKEMDSRKTPEQREAAKAEREADDARAQLAEAERQERGSDELATVETAKITGPLDPAMPAGDHMAQKFGNDPENPHIAKGEHADPEKATVRLKRITPDVPEGPVKTVVHPEMVGDYLRAGWEPE